MPLLHTFEKFNILPGGELYNGFFPVRPFARMSSETSFFPLHIHGANIKHLGLEQGFDGSSDFNLIRLFMDFEGYLIRHLFLECPLFRDMGLPDHLIKFHD